MNKVPEGWNLVSIGDIAKLTAGGTPSTSRTEYWENGNIPWMTSGDVHKRVIRDVKGRITEKGLKASATKIIPVKSIFVALAGQGKTRGTVAISEIELTTNQSIAAIIIKNKDVNPYYIFHNLSNRYEELRSESGGSGRAGLNLQILSDIALSLPPFAEQSKIAEILSSVDRSIEATENLMAKLADLKKALMQELFTKGIGHTKFKNSPLGRIPEEWEVTNLDKISTKITDGEHQTPSRTKDGIYLLSARNVLNGKLALEDVDYIPQCEYDRISTRCNPQSGDILISCSGTIGRVCIVPDNITFALVRSVALIKLKKTEANPNFIAQALQSPQLQEQIGASISQLAQGNLFQGQIKRLMLPLPSLKEQTEIASILSASDAKIEKAKSRLNKLQDMKKGLMQDLLTGKVRV